MLARRRLRSLALAAALVAACGDDDPNYVLPDGAPPVFDAAPGDPDAEAPVLRIDYLDPDHGPFAGGTEVLLRGRGFAEGMSVTIGGRAVEALDLQVVDDRRAVLVTPPGDPGPAEVAVAAAGLEATLPGGFAYEAILVDPPSGSVAGGTFVTIQGFGTTFQDGDEVTLDGAPLVGVVVAGEQQITGYTPAGIAGTADVEVTGPGGTIGAEDAFTYLSTADPFEGGLGGGPIAGTLNVAVIDAMTSDGVEGAFVTVDDPATSTMTGLTDSFGQITFATPTFTGPVTVTAAKEGYERSSFVTFDARDVSIFLVPMPDPDPGPLPPGRAAGTILGHILFGDATGIGTPEWDLVPAPRTANERKRAYVFTTLANPFSGNPDPGIFSVVDYVGDGRVAWEYAITARPAAVAVVAVAGLYDDTIDPDGPSGPLAPGVFYPFAMGVTRGILVGPGEAVANVDIIIDVPLDTALEIDLVSPPPLNTPGWYGPTQYQLQAFVDLGGEGVIGLPGSRATLPTGATSGVLTGMAPLAGPISDGSYTIFAGAYAPYGSNPFSVRVVRGVDDLSAPIVVDGFLGVPRPVDPPNYGVASSMHLQFLAEGATTGTATFSMHRLQSATDGAPLWRIFARGDQLDIPLYDLVTSGALPPIPATPEYVYWTIYEITVPGLDFDDFNYRHLNANYWSAYAADVFVVQFPPNP